MSSIHLTLRTCMTGTSHAIYTLATQPHRALPTPSPFFLPYDRRPRHVANPGLPPPTYTLPEDRIHLIEFPLCYQICLFVVELCKLLGCSVFFSSCRVFICKPIHVYPLSVGLFPYFFRRIGVFIYLQR